VHWSISLKFSTEFQHVTANTLVQGQRVKGQGHSVRNSQHRFTAKCVSFSYLFSAWARWEVRVVGVAPRGGCQAALRKTSENNIFKPNEPEKTQNVSRDVVRPSRYNAFAIARFLVLFLFFRSGKRNVAVLIRRHHSLWSRSDWTTCRSVQSAEEAGQIDRK